eukprot:1601816-Pyramimonas_sp.AAC.1
MTAHCEAERLSASLPWQEPLALLPDPPIASSTSAKLSAPKGRGGGTCCKHRKVELRHRLKSTRWTSPREICTYFVVPWCALVGYVESSSSWTS